MSKWVSARPGAFPLKDLVPAIQGLEGAHRVVTSARYVNLDAGTGLVHTAPGHGREDFETGLKYGLEILSPLNDDGTYTDQAGRVGTNTFNLVGAGGTGGAGLHTAEQSEHGHCGDER